MSWLHAVILGIIQGLTEFLPVSSSGHLIVLKNIFGITAEGDDMLLFTILLHVGTLVSVFIVYRKRILNMLLHPFTSELKWLVVATLPAVAAALIFDFSKAFEGAFLPWSFWLTSVVLIMGDFLHKRMRSNTVKNKKIGAANALSMGVMQAVAILPGLSRSGSTISGGVASGLSHKKAADFSFLMSIPAILGSLALELLDVIKGERMLLSVNTGTAIAGVVAAAVFGLLAIKLMLRLLQKTSMKWFALYTFILGSFVLMDKYIFHFFPW